jgi:hypothetical protein
MKMLSLLLKGLHLVIGGLSQNLRRKLPQNRHHVVPAGSQSLKRKILSRSLRPHHAVPGHG